MVYTITNAGAHKRKTTMRTTYEFEVREYKDGRRVSSELYPTLDAVGKVQKNDAQVTFEDLQIFMDGDYTHVLEYRDDEHYNDMYFVPAHHFKKHSEHTPGEWKETQTGIKDSKDRLIAQCWCGDKGQNDSFGRLQSVGYREMLANSQRIVKAVNMHDDLVERLTKLVKYVDDNFNVRGDGIIQELKAFLKQAETK